MNYTEHSLLVGEKGKKKKNDGKILTNSPKATQFALAMGFKEESLETPESREMHGEWLHANCQPNFWKVRKKMRRGHFGKCPFKNVHPDPNTRCGPYQPDWPQSSSPNPSWRVLIFFKNPAANSFQIIPSRAFYSLKSNLLPNSKCPVSPNGIGQFLMPPITTQSAWF